MCISLMSMSIQGKIYNSFFTVSTAHPDRSPAPQCGKQDSVQVFTVCTGLHLCVCSVHLQSWTMLNYKPDTKVIFITEHLLEALPQCSGYS